MAENTKIEWTDHTFNPWRLRNKLIAYLRDNREKFIDLDKTMLRANAHKMKTALGYTATFKSKKWLYLTADRFQKIVGKGSSTEGLKMELVKAAVMDRAANGRYVVQRPLFADMKGNKGYRHVHAFRTKMVDAEV